MCHCVLTFNQLTTFTVFDFRIFTTFFGVLYNACCRSEEHVLGNTRLVFVRLSNNSDAHDLWLTCDHFVGKVSAMRHPTGPSQPFMFLGSVNE